MLSIGEFARLAGVSVRMLRHYDRLGLLPPRRVDPYTAYRFYSVEQLERANQLVALKDLGFTLEEVGRLLGDGLPPEAVTALLRERRDALRAQLDADGRRLRSVEARLRAIEKENPVSEFIETSLPALRLVQLSARLAEMDEIESAIGPMFDRVNEAIDSAGIRRVGAGVATYTQDGDAMVIAAAEQIGDSAPPPGLETVDLPAVPRAITVRYVAPDISGIGQAWQELAAEVDRRGLSRSGPIREVYHSAGDEGAGWDVDLQQPLA